MNDTSVVSGDTITADEVDHFLSGQSVYAEIRHKYGEGPLSVTGDKVESITTHCAKIFLGDGFAAKIKLPVQYSYLDMSSLKDRHKFLLKELEINQPHLPDIYLGLAAIVKEDDQTLKLMFAESHPANNEVLEWCLIMRRFREKDVLDNRAKNGELTNEIAAQLGASVAGYHNSIDRMPVRDGDERINEVIKELQHELHKVASVFDETDISEFAVKTNQEYLHCRDALKTRGEAGYVRRCHGDLHLRNILLYQGRPVPFDALEFSERFASIDMLYDLAFLLMDLDHRDLVEQQNILLNEYLLRTDELNIAAVKLLSLFMCCRAGIKAMTTAQAATACKKPNKAKVQEANQYLKRALQYLQPKRPVVVAIGGFSGSGKSTVARQLSTRVCQSPGAVLFRSDVERKAEFGVDEIETLEAKHYSVENSQRVYERVLRRLKLAVGSQYPVIVDATFLSEDQRKRVAKIASNAGVRFFGFWLMAPVEVMRQRINLRSGDASDADTAVLDKQLKRPKGHIDWHAIDTNQDIEKTLIEIIRITA